MNAFWGTRHAARLRTASRPHHDEALAGNPPRTLGRFATLPHSIAIVGVVVLALFGPMMAAGGASGDGNASRQILYLLALALAVVGALPWQRPTRLLVLPGSLVLALAWCWLSLSWSIDVGVSLRRLVLTTMLIWTIFLSVDGLGYARTIVLVRGVLLVVLVLNLLTVALLPRIGIHQAYDVHDPGLIGAWCGILGHKNFAGAVAAVTILILLYGSRDLSPRVRLGALVLASVFLLGTLAKTSMGIALLSIVVGWLVRGYNRAYRVFLLPVGMAVIAVGLLTIDTGLDTVGRTLWDPTAFTGRTEIWLPLLSYVRDHPLTGAGFGAVWNIGNAREPIVQYATGWVTVQTSAHNGFLDLAAQVGIPGLMLGVMALFVAPMIRLIGARTFSGERAGLLAAMLVFAFGHNFTESSLFERDIIVHVFLILTIALVHRAAKASARQPVRLRGAGTERVAGGPGLA